MALEQKLSLKLAQKLVMTPSLQQAIKLLQMTRMELDTLVTQELVENPVLEDVTEGQEEAAPEEPVEREAEPEKANGEPEPSDSIENIDLDTYFGEYWESSGYPSMREVREAPPFENSLSHEPDLYDHLLWQLHMSGVDPRRRQICELIIGNLNPDGFLVATLEEIEELAAADDEPCTREEVEEALALVRTFDPPSVSCRDLRESLVLQLDARGVAADHIARRVLEEHWELFLRRQFPAIAKKLGIELAELEPAVELIRTLETRPGREFGSERAQYIEPDVHVYKVSGEYLIQLNDDGLPRLRVSRAYRRMLQTMRHDSSQSKTKQFIKNKIQSAV